MKKLIKICSLCLFFTSCYLNKFIPEKNKIYLEKIENLTNQPILSFLLNEKIKEVLLKYPGYDLISLKENADYVIKLTILEFERIPLFYSKDNPDEISGARYIVKLKVFVKKQDKSIFEKDLYEYMTTSIFKTYREENILNKISERMAIKLYFEILNLDKK